MVDPKVAILGFIHSVAFTLNGVGIFTPAWITMGGTYYSILHIYLGILPLQSGEPTWFFIASLLMFASFAVFIMMTIMYLALFTIASKKELSCEHRKWFHIYAGTGMWIVAFTLTAVILIGVNINLTGNPLSLGFSAWFCVVAAILTLTGGALSGYIAQKVCC